MINLVCTQIEFLICSGPHGVPTHPLRMLTGHIAIPTIGPRADSYLTDESSLSPDVGTKASSPLFLALGDPTDN